MVPAGTVVTLDPIKNSVKIKKKSNIMTSKKTTKVRTYVEDNEYLKLLALKVSAKLERITNTAEILNGIIEEVKQERGNSIEQVSAMLSDRIKRSL
jgi:hypothetical protein